jgi:hypothetical protein
MPDFFYTSVILSCCLLVTAFIYGISNKRLRNNELSKWYIIYLGFILTVELLAFFFIDIIESNTTQFIYPFYVTGEFFILVSLFLKKLRTSKKAAVIKWLMTSYIFIETTTLWFMNNDATSGLFVSYSSN